MCARGVQGKGSDLGRSSAAPWREGTLLFPCQHAVRKGRKVGLLLSGNGRGNVGQECETLPHELDVAAQIVHLIG